MSQGRQDRDRELVELVDAFVAGGLDRRAFVKRMAGLGGGAIFGGSLASLALSRPAGAAPASGRAARGSRFQADPPPAPGGTAVVATVDKPVNMDPAFSQLYSSMQVYQNIYNSLIYVDADFNFTPGLAKSWSQVDPLTWQFELVDNATFHNGEHFTARDVAYTVERTLDPELAAPNAAFLRAVESVETEGDYTVRFKLKYPWGSFLADLKMALEIVNEKAINAADTRLNPVGTGPFKMTEWVQDEYITLERWENYHVPDRPYLDKVIFRAIADDTVRQTGLQTDELQWVQQIPLQKIEELKTAGGDVKVTVAKPYLPDFLYLNASKPPFDDVRVREAVARCLNRADIVNVVFFGQAVESTEAIYDGNPYYTGLNPWADGPDYDRAKALLAEAGLDGLNFDFDGQPQVATQIKTAQVIQQHLREAGIEMEIQNYESGDWITRLNTLEYSATSSYWSVTVDPVQFYFPKLHSESVRNNTGYASPEMDALLDACAQETDVEKRKAAYKAVIEKVNADVVAIPLDIQLLQYWTRANVFGMEPLPTLEVRMETVYFSE